MYILIFMVSNNIFIDVSLVIEKKLEDRKGEKNIVKMWYYDNKLKKYINVNIKC